ncbi:hypothetical protein B0T17DRAFT_276244 [Bombardia bombarda]|uniref:Cytochrome P450 n=1 Tax=Bombardia bombarda TaxID=252184 RepID=A0AA39X2B9_9PEZI|nr:hypothetical protein B0T17DRAFT_276244 [Bombardia bombarda]
MTTNTCLSRCKILPFCLWICGRPQSPKGSKIQLLTKTRPDCSVAGSITTAAAIRHTFLALILTPVAYAALQKEIDDKIASGDISTPIITNLEIQSLPYLQAVVLEGLRMWPPTTGFGSKQVPPGGRGDADCA